MTIIPVKASPTPKYPDKYGEEVRRILMSAKPRRWWGTPMVAGVLTATVAFSAAGCDVKPGGGSAGGVPIATVSSLLEASATPMDTGNMLEYITDGAMPTPTLPTQYSMLIPVFEYGEGTGTIGCESVAAPVFLSEEEAFAIIAAVFAENGMTLSRGGDELTDAALPVTNMYSGWTDGDDAKSITQGMLAPDGSLEEENLPVEFISTTDVQRWQKDTGMMSSVATFAVKDAAQVLAENNPGLVVFYDPIASSVNYQELWEMRQESGETEAEYNIRYDAKIRELSETSRAESEQLLRQQVEAFIEWLGAAE